MKAHCGQGLRIIVAAALLTGVAPGHAQTPPAPQESPAEEVKTPAPQDIASTNAPVMAVRIVTEDGRVLSEAPSGVSVGGGRPSDRDQVADTLRPPYPTQHYSHFPPISPPRVAGVP